MSEKDLLPIPLHLPKLSGEIDRLLEEFIHHPWGYVSAVQEWHPSIDLYEERCPGPSLSADSAAGQVMANEVRRMP